jgi:tRNA(Ile)-lysidine synthase
VVEGEEMALEVEGLPREIRRRLLKRAIETLRDDPAPWREDGLDRLLETLESGGRATLAGVLASGGATWRLRRAPPRRL